MKITVSASLLFAANAFRAKQDVRRPYLEGVHLNCNGHIEATDGAACLTAEHSACRQLSESVIINFGFVKLPPRALLAEITIDGASGTILLLDDKQKPVLKSGVPVVLPLQVVKGEFPIVARVIPKLPPVPTEQIGVAPRLLSLVSDLCRVLKPVSHVSMTFRGPEQAVVVGVPGWPEITVVLMPYRL